MSAAKSIHRWAARCGADAGRGRFGAGLITAGDADPGAPRGEPDGNLARFTGDAGDAAGARDQFAALLPVEERVLGPEHPDTLVTRCNLAWWTGQAGDPARARDQFAALLPIRERVSGPEHPATLTARRDLAYWTMKADGDAGRRMN